ncbi:MAG: cytochrome b/b6 domain-containing protein [Oceanospirillaceae bacterium]|nr:cytochrome b/b6 domain-containing protein [Oceanospirillaceae bacterium]
MALLTKQVPVWDILIRIFHWSLVFSFALAWITADEWDAVHSWAGYTLAGLLGFRLVWGLIGTTHARFINFIYSWSEVKQYLRSLLTIRPKHYLGHNPAGSWMVLLLILVLAMTCLSGMTLYATEGQGPLAGTFLAHLSDGWVEEVHEFFANSVLALVFVHVAGVLVSSLLHAENLVKAMVTGKKQVGDTEVSDETY